MKQLALLPAILALAFATASAQIRSGYGGIQTTGIPASVTSPTPSNPFPGIPASVTSLHNRPPSSVTGHFQAVPFGHRDFDRDHDRDFNHHRHPRLNNGFGYGYLYPYVYGYDDSDYADQQQYQQPQPEPEAPAMTVFENRPGYKAPPAQVVEPSPQPAQPEPDEPATLLVFKDGRQLEIGNYAIVGDTLYSVADQRSYKIPLAQLDLPATVKANEDRGIEFHLPKKSA